MAEYEDSTELDGSGLLEDESELLVDFVNSADGDSEFFCTGVKLAV
jgi:hypothetical protein